MPTAYCPDRLAGNRRQRLGGHEKLVAFAVGTYSAKRTSDLDQAAQALAGAVSILSIDLALALLFRRRPAKTFHEPHGSMLTYRHFTRVMPKAGPTAMYEARLIFTRARFAGQAGTKADNVATVGRNFYPEARSLTDAVRGVRRGVYHERVHQRLTQAFSLLGRPALYAKLGAYKRSYILRYIEEAAAEAYRLRKIGAPAAGELTALEFLLNGRYGITLTKMGQEAHGILLGPVTVGGATFVACYGLTGRDH